MSGVAAFGARAELEVPVVTDGDRPFHRIYVVGKGDSREQDDAFAEDLNALITDLNQSKNHKSLNSISLIRPSLAWLEGAINGAKVSAQPGDAVTIYFSGNGNVETFRLGDGVNISATELAELLDGFKAGVKRTIILDSCFGGSFEDDIGESEDVAVIGTSTTCPYNAPFDDFLQTFSEDIAKLAGQGAGDSNSDGIVTAEELRSGLLELDWKLGEADDAIREGKSKCDGDCDLPAITVSPAECGPTVDVTGSGFGTSQRVEIEVLDSDLDQQGAIVEVDSDPDGNFAANDVDVLETPALIVATDKQPEPATDWHFCEPGAGVVDDTAPSCELVAGLSVIDATVQDLESGLAEIRVRRASNVYVDVPDFTVGTTDPVEFQATILNPTRTARLRLDIRDVAGNRTICSKTVRRRR